MNRKIIAALLLVVLALIWVRVYWTRTPELFGDGKLYFIESRDNIGGLVIGWGIYALYGKKQDCRMIPLWSPVLDAEKIACKIVFNQKHTIFKGWIDFRGHPRPFCGAREYENIPAVCFGE